MLTGSAPTLLAGTDGGRERRNSGFSFGAARKNAWSCSSCSRAAHIDKARALQNVLLKVSKVIASEHAIAGLKFAMDQRGYRGGIPRLPLVPINAAYKQRILESLVSLDPVAARA